MKLHRIQRLTRVSIHSCVAVVFLDLVELDDMCTFAMVGTYMRFAYLRFFTIDHDDIDA